MPAKKKADKKEEQVFAEEKGSYVHEEQCARYVGGVRRLTESTFRCRHGHGTFTSPTIRYEGDWHEDEMHGTGELRFLQTGDSYTGGFVHGTFDGQGTYRWASGAVYVGAWRGNRMHGVGVYTDVNGKVWHGKFYNGTGPGLRPFASSDVKKEEEEEGKKEKVQQGLLKPEAVPCKVVSM